jgi:hypothetical protein
MENKPLPDYIDDIEGYQHHKTILNVSHGINAFNPERT